MTQDWTIGQAREHVLACMDYERPPDPSEGPDARYGAVTRSFPIPESCHISADEIAGTAGKWATPRDAHTGLVIVHAHGGGYYAGSSETHARLAADIAEQANARVFVPDYDRTPDATHPRQRDQVCDIVRHLSATGDVVVLGGDSAGGGIVFNVLTALRDQGEQLPTAAYVIGPMIDLEAVGGSYEEFAEHDPFLNLMIHRNVMIPMFLGQTSATDPGANALHADLSGLPPILIQVADDEALRDDSISIAKQLGDAGVEVELSVYSDVLHDWPMLAPAFEPGRRAIIEIVEFLAARLD